MNRLILLICSTTLTFALVRGFDCSGTTNCSCSIGIRGDYELLCPQGLQSPKIIAQVAPEQYAHIQCTETNNWEELRLLAGLKVGPIKSFILRFCPLPGISFKELLRTVGIPSTQAMQIVSHGNLSNTLTKKHLENLKDVERLNLNANSLTELPEDLFQDATNLTWLDLKNNNVQLPKNIFRNIPKLEVLELGSNNISYLEPGIFKNLSKLRLLNLWANKLKNLSRALFSDVTNLENLDLNSNGLLNLPPDIFADLTKLKNINLANNNFTSLPQGLFLSNANLEKIQIHSNRQVLYTLPSGLFANLTKLQNIYLQSNNLTSLPEDLLVGASSLISIDLTKNRLETLPADLFKDAKKLENINISYNKLTTLPNHIFKSNTELKTLNLAYNAITTVTEYTFSSQTSLEILNLSNNKIEIINEQAFAKTAELKTINLSNNRISKFSSYYSDKFGHHSILQSSIRLEAIYLAHNNITEIYSDWLISMTNLQIVDLSYNYLPSLSYSELHSVLAQRLVMDLSYNQISFISLKDAERLSADKLGDNWRDKQYSMIRVVLKGNPFVCDCNAYNLVSYFRQQLAPQVRAVVEFDGTDFTCAEGNNDLAGCTVSKLDPRLLVCELSPCPSNCSCYYRPDDKGLLVDCNERGFDVMPSHMPNNDTIQNIEIITNHTELDLSHNKLQILPSIFGPGYDRINKINLSYNNIRQLNMSAFSENLEVINLDHNNMSRMDTSSLFISKSLKTIILSNNPWRCDCQAKDFITFVRNNDEKINRSNTTCKYGKPGVPLFRISDSEICPIVTSEYIGIISLVMGVFGLLIGGIATFYYRFQREIKVWLYAHGMCLWFVTEEELDKDKQYDAFVSYSSLDANFVEEKLVPGLENGPTRYKLCVHYRDWIVGDFIPNQIARSVEESRRTIVVLSPNFIESVWGRMEFRAAHSQALSEGRARVIVILYGDIGPTENLDPELKAYLTMNTYVKWGDPWFWSKLRYALPHPSDISKGVPLITQPGKRQKRTSHSEKLIMNGADNNILNQSITTPPADSIIADPLKLIDSKPA
ncbi:hypothetical protein O3M35_009929 [Rhynocoris fuscipes]|uniref:TIR domain-containing protein n=1 Tax=Rhynocoris fuscipes TaxID=488301 RepID=A0AAW1DAM9_9HEMI